jgi:hypothetical protein
MPRFVRQPPRKPSLFAGPNRPSDTASVAALLEGRALAAPIETRIAALVNALGRNGLVQQVGVMHGREQADIRLVLTPLSGFGCVFRAASGAGCEGPFDDARELVARYAPLVDGSALALAIGADGTVAAGVGVELQLRTFEPAERLLSALVEDGLAEPALAASLLRWHGHAHDLAGHVTPRGFAVARKLTRGRAAPAIIRRIHHLKLTLAPGAPPTAKAYLGARPYLAL